MGAQPKICRNKKAGVVARATLKLVQPAIDWHTRWSHPLVSSQFKESERLSRWAEAPSLATTPPLDLVLRMEELIRTADTVQQRCMAGFFTLRAMSSARASDAQSLRKISLGEFAVAGKSL